MISMDDGSTFPQYDAMAMWSRAGSELLPTAVEDDVLRVYATRHDDGRLTALVFNLSGAETTRTIRLAGGAPVDDAELVSVWAADLSDTTMSTESSSVPVSDGRLSMVLPPWSMNALEVGAP